MSLQPMRSSEKPTDRADFVNQFQYYQKRHSQDRHVVAIKRGDKIEVHSYPFRFVANIVSAWYSSDKTKVFQGHAALGELAKAAKGKIEHEYKNFKDAKIGGGGDLKDRGERIESAVQEFRGKIAQGLYKPKELDDISGGIKSKLEKQMAFERLEKRLDESFENPFDKLEYNLQFLSFLHENRALIDPHKKTEYERRLKASAGECLQAIDKQLAQQNPVVTDVMDLYRKHQERLVKAQQLGIDTAPYEAQLKTSAEEWLKQIGAHLKELDPFAKEAMEMYEKFHQKIEVAAKLGINATPLKEDLGVLQNKIINVRKAAYEERFAVLKKGIEENNAQIIEKQNKEVGLNAEIEEADKRKRAYVSQKHVVLAEYLGGIGKHPALAAQQTAVQQVVANLGTGHIPEQAMVEARNQIAQLKKEAAAGRLSSASAWSSNEEAPKVQSKLVEKQQALEKLQGNNRKIKQAKVARGKWQGAIKNAFSEERLGKIAGLDMKALNENEDYRELQKLLGRKLDKAIPDVADHIKNLMVDFPVLRVLQEEIHQEARNALVGEKHIDTSFLQTFEEAFPRHPDEDKNYLLRDAIRSIEQLANTVEGNEAGLREEIGQLERLRNVFTQPREVLQKEILDSIGKLQVLHPDLARRKGESDEDFIKRAGMLLESKDGQERLVNARLKEYEMKMRGGIPADQKRAILDAQRPLIGEEIHGPLEILRLQIKVFNENKPAQEVLQRNIDSADRAIAGMEKFLKETDALPLEAMLRDDKVTERDALRKEIANLEGERKMGLEKVAEMEASRKQFATRADTLLTPEELNKFVLETNQHIRSF